MPEHDHDATDIETSDLVHAGLTAPSAGPLPSGVRDRLRGRRRARRARLAGGVLGGAAMVVVLVVLIQPTPSTSSPVQPDQPKMATNVPDPTPSMVGEIEPLRLDDPMFAALDGSADITPPEMRWSIGSYLRGDVPSGI